jgi:hypothetical protein
MNYSKQPPPRPLKRLQRITLYPTLVSRHQFWLQLYNVEQCVFTVHLYTLSGVEVFTRFYVHEEINSNHTIQVHEHIPRGIYKVAIRCEDIQYLQNIIIE